MGAPNKEIKTTIFISQYNRKKIQLLKIENELLSANGVISFLIDHYEKTK